MTAAAKARPEREGSVGSDDRVAHLVLKDSWPVALCGATVKDHLGNAAPGRDRCADCLKIANRDRLGRPAWEIGA